MKYLNDSDKINALILAFTKKIERFNNQRKKDILDMNGEDSSYITEDMLPNNQDYEWLENIMDFTDIESELK